MHILVDKFRLIGPQNYEQNKGGPSIPTPKIHARSDFDKKTGFQFKHEISSLVHKVYSVGLYME